MALTIVSREAAGLPPVPSSIGHRSLTSWTGIKVHHTGGAFSSWRAVHDWQTAGRPAGERLAYIGYSFGVADGRVTELRGWDHQPAHDHENSTLGMVFGGSYVSRLPSPEDLAVFVEFCRFARERTGRALPITGHRDTWPAGDRRYSACPGDRLYAHLPELRARAEEDDMPTAEQIADAVLSRRYRDYLTGEQSTVSHQLYSGRRDSALAVRQVGDLAGQVAGLTELVRQLAAADPVPLTPEQLAELTAAVEAAARVPGERIEAALAAAGAELQELAPGEVESPVLVAAPAGQEPA